MKLRTIAVSLALAAGLGIAGAAQAEGKIYIGGTAGFVDADAPGFDNAHVIGVYGGYNMLGKDSHFAADLKGGNLAIEGEVLFTLLDGDAGTFGDWSISTLGVFAAYRHPLTNKFYIKGKAGLVRYDIDVSGGTGDSDTALALGGAGGWKVGPGNLEVGLTSYQGDIDSLLVTAGFHMTF